MKKTYKPGDKIKLSDFSKNQAKVISEQIDRVSADQAGLDFFSQKLRQDRNIMLELIKQSAPVLKDYHFTVSHNTKVLKITIDRRLMKTDDII